MADNKNQISVGSRFGEFNEGVDMTQLTWAAKRYTAYWSAVSGTTLTSQKMFNSTNLPDQYSSGALVNQSRSENIRFESARASHNVQLAAISSQPTSVTLQYFELFTTIAIQTQNKTWDSFKLTDLLPSTWVGNNVASTGATQISKAFHDFQLPIYLDVPSDGSININIIPASDLTVLAAATTVPTLPGLGLTSNQGYYVDLEMWGFLWRKLA